MTAPQLLSEVEARGGTVAVALDADGAQRLKITPSGLVPDLIGDLQRFKPQLLELLSAPPVPVLRDQPPATMTDVATVRAQLRALDEALGSDGAIYAVQRAHRQIERATGQRQWLGVAASQRHAEAVALALLNNEIDPETITPEATPEATTAPVVADVSDIVRYVWAQSAAYWSRQREQNAARARRAK